MISGPVAVAESIANSALLQSTSVSDSGNNAEHNGPTGRDASLIHPTVSSHGLTVSCEGLLALYLMLSDVKHDAPMQCNALNRTKAFH